MAIKLSQVDILAGGFYNKGEPLNGGKVFFYEPGTTSFKTVYKDPDKSTNHSNPVPLDAQGRALVFADGFYKVEIRDRNNLIVQSWDNMFFPPGLIDGSALTDADLDAEGGVAVIFSKAYSAVGTTALHNANAPYKYRVLDAWILKTDAIAGTVKLTDGANDITDTMTQGTTDQAIVRAATIDDQYHEIAADGTLNIVVATGGAGIVNVLAVRVA